MALARVGAHAGHPATSADKNAPSAAIPEWPLEGFQKRTNRYVAIDRYAQKSTALKSAAAISKRAYVPPKFPTDKS